jgi:tetratricopeptide (TPR) repeat protein
MDHYREGIAAFHRNDYERAEAHLAAAAEENPRRAEAHANLARARLLLGRIDEALPAAQHAVEHGEHDVYNHAVLAMVLVKATRYEDAVAVAERAPAVDPGAPGLLLLLLASIDARLALDDVPRAVSDAIRAAHIAPEVPDAHVKLARALGCACRFGEAMLAIERAQALAPDSQLPRKIRTSLENGMATVREDLARAEAEDASADRALRVAACRVKLGERDAGLAALDEAVRIAPLDADVWAARGDILRRMGLFPLDVEAYQEADRLRRT